MKYEIIRGFCGADELTRVNWNADETRFTALTDSQDAGYWVEFRLRVPKDAYIMIPACAYDGNRFEGVMRKYAPMFNEDEFGLDVPVRMTQVPRLAREGDSFMDVTTGDMAAPCVCVFDRAAREGFILAFDQGAHGLNHGVSLERRGDILAIRLRAPAKRRLVYRWYEGVPSLRENPEADAPLKVTAGDETVIPHRMFCFPCESVTALYREFFEKRYALFHGRAQANLPFSAYWDMVEKQLNLTHFVEDGGFYALNARDGRNASRFGEWQAGWVGGGMSTLPLICEGGELSRERAVRTLEFAARYQSVRGWYYGIVSGGKAYHDCFGKYESKHNLVLVRKHADLTYFMFKQIAALESMGLHVPETVRQSAVAAADALCAAWEKYGQLGQFVNSETGEIKVGGSASGAIAPAALCAAAEVTGELRYLDTAREIGEFFYLTATANGVTTGGPGEILQAPDSESAAALVESYVALYEAGHGDVWLARACEAAQQLASWVVAYDYEFPPESRFGRMGICATGSVWANVQNKHSAPGMCTLSSAMLLKIYRATGDIKYLELMRQIAHFSPQVASYPQRPMYTAGLDGAPLKPGEMCERVNLSDWEGREGVGDSIFGASSWPQAALMLTWLEVPGVYAVPELGVVCASDHVNAYLEDDALHIQNTTAFSARVRLLVERGVEMQRRLGLWWQDRLQVVDVPAGGSVRVEV